MSSNEGSDQGGSGLARLLTAQRVIAILLIIAFAVWCVVNSDEVTVDFLVTETEVRLFVALLLAAVIGAAVGYLAGRRQGD